MEDLPFWLALAAQAGGPVLELGCGTGRILIPLAQAGFRVIGLDRDRAMLKYLQANAVDQHTSNYFLIQADIDHFCLATQFPLILLPCNTLSTLTAAQRRSCLEGVRRHLLPGGIFATSLPNPVMLEHLPARSESQPEEEFIHPRTGHPVQVSSAWRRTKQLFTVTWHYDHLFPDGTVDRTTVAVAHQRMPLDAYLVDFKAAGLAKSKLYGDYDYSLYSDDSPGLIILATG